MNYGLFWRLIAPEPKVMWALLTSNLTNATIKRLIAERVRQRLRTLEEAIRAEAATGSREP